MRKCIAVIGSGILGTFCATTFGGLTVTSYPDLPASTVVAPWPASTTYGSTPRQKTIVDLNNVAGGSAMVNETLSTNRAMAGEFRIPSGAGFQLGSIGVCISGAAHLAPDTSIHLYRMDKPNPFVSGSIGPGPNPQLNDGATSTGYTVSTDSEDINAAGALDNDLLGGGAGLTFTFNGGGATNRVVEFVLDGADQVNLTPGVYGFEIWNTGTDSIFWRRYTNASNGLITAFNNSDAAIAGSFGNRIFQTTNDVLAVAPGSTITRSEIIGDGGRRVSLALYAVPEPASMAVFGLAATALFLRRRRA